MIAVIPAGGKGTRMLPETRAFPKEMIHAYAATPVIGMALESLKKVGVERAIIITGRKKGALMDYIGDGSSFGMEVFFVQQSKPLGLGHAILCAKNYFKDVRDENFLVYLGDTIIKPEESLKTLIEFHEKRNGFATLLLDEVVDPEPFGVVKFSKLENGSGPIVEMFEKPKTDGDKERFKVGNKWYAIAGIYVLNKEIFGYLERTGSGAGGEIQLTDAIFACVKDEKSVFGMVNAGERIDVGKWRDFLPKVRDYWRSLSDEELEELIRDKEEKVERLRNE